ncbi:hypothetical protein Tco_0752546 [Tanacetum coccineum]|uniref:Uncharacterized protein n=1 Tax=Tanacetum coccineum TaxID=301880 RepID=A0ABQ4ZAE6_9ASTR
MVINSPCLTYKKELAIPGQTVTGKEFSNPLMAGSLLKTISAKFWNTATSKTVNSVKQIHAIVNGKAVVILESSIRGDFLFNDEDGITCLTNDEIFKNLALMGEMITSQLQAKLWLYDKVRTRLCLFCHHQIGEDYWDSRFDETK